MARRIGIDVLAVEPDRAQRQHPRPRGCNVLHHVVQVKLLRHGGIGPGRRPVTRRTLERQARGSITGGDHHPSLSRYVTGNPNNAE